MTKPAKKGSDWATLRRVVGLATPFRSLFVWSFFLGIMVAVVTPIRPYLIQLTVDKNILEKGGGGSSGWAPSCW